MKTVTVDATAGGVKIDDAGNRDFLNIKNNGGETIFLKYDGSTDVLTSANGWPLAAGDSFYISNDGHRNVYNKEVRAISSGGSVDVRVQGA